MHFRKLLLPMSVMFMLVASSCSSNPGSLLDESQQNLDAVVKAAGSQNVSEVQYSSNGVLVVFDAGSQFTVWSGGASKKPSQLAAHNDPIARGKLSPGDFAISRVAETAKSIQCGNGESIMYWAPVTPGNKVLARFACRPSSGGGEGTTKKVTLDGKEMPSLGSVTDPADLDTALAELKQIVGTKWHNVLIRPNDSGIGTKGFAVTAAKVSGGGKDCLPVYTRSLTPERGAEVINCDTEAVSAPFDVSGLSGAKITQAMKVAETRLGGKKVDAVIGMRLMAVGGKPVLEVVDLGANIRVDIESGKIL